MMSVLVRVKQNRGHLSVSSDANCSIQCEWTSTCPLMRFTDREIEKNDAIRPSFLIIYR